MVGATFPAPVKVLPIRVINMQDSADVFGTSSAIRYAAGETLTFGGKNYTNPLANQTKVINLSLGGTLSPGSSTALELCSAVTYAKSKGVLVMAASGNDGSSKLLYPAACEDAVAVGSVGPKNAALELERATYSSTGEGLTLSAPGGSNGDFKKNEPKYEAKQGTSQATPQVAALAALIWSLGLETTSEGVLERMKNTALDLGSKGRDINYGFGVIQPLKALKIAP